MRPSAFDTQPVFLLRAVATRMKSLHFGCNQPCLVVLTLLIVSASSFAPRVAFTTPKTIEKSPTTSLWLKRRGRPRGPLRTVEVKPTMNEEITYDELRVVLADPKGGKDEALGIITKADALAKAQELGGLDVILINENSSPPVCKIVDYSKYRYMKEKKAKELKKASKASEVKEVKMSYKIDVHDYGVRKKNASKFINQGNRVKITIMFRGREVQHDKLGYELIDKLALDLEDICNKEGRPVREGRNLSVILSPRPEVLKAVNDGRRAEEKAKKKKREARLKEQKHSKAEQVEDNSASLDDGINLNQVALEESASDLDSDEDLESSLDSLLGADGVKDDLFN